MNREEETRCVADVTEKDQLEVAQVATTRGVIHLGDIGSDSSE